ncbi:MAG: hypothetical protein P4M11_15090 [Candidatus Pacebacteria bacterium]|nr:hypothetical protein [Candidatus Paceibacterota bacterium]
METTNQRDFEHDSQPKDRSPPPKRQIHNLVQLSGSPENIYTRSGNKVYAVSPADVSDFDFGQQNYVVVSRSNNICAAPDCDDAVSPESATDGPKPGLTIESSFPELPDSMISTPKLPGIPDAPLPAVETKGNDSARRTFKIASKDFTKLQNRTHYRGNSFGHGSQVYRARAGKEESLQRPQEVFEAGPQELVADAKEDQNEEVMPETKLGEDSLRVHEESSSTIKKLTETGNNSDVMLENSSNAVQAEGGAGNSRVMPVEDDYEDFARNLKQMESHDFQGSFASDRLRDEQSRRDPPPPSQPLPQPATQSETRPAAEAKEVPEALTEKENETRKVVDASEPRDVPKTLAELSNDVKDVKRKVKHMQSNTKLKEALQLFHQSNVLSPASGSRNT